ncbi:hypothetical protein Misp01_21710 [Microtetraspora sp. NBRC 13810]|nr:hypothetical protein Misp01_21710 [Microtetraspora sp. NBRC 13810]
MRGEVRFGFLLAGPDAEDLGDLAEGAFEPPLTVDALEFHQFLFVVPAVGVGEQGGRDGFVGDERGEPAGVPDGQVQAEHGAEAAAEHVRGPVRELGEQPLDVVGVLGHGRAGGRVVQGAAGQAAPVVGDDGVGVGEPDHQVCRTAGVAFAALGDEQGGAVAADFVVEPGAGDREISVHAGECIRFDASVLM